MRKILFLSLFWGILTIGHCQNQRFDISWGKSKVFSTVNNQIELPNFDAKNFNFSFDKGLIYTAILSVNQKIDTKNTNLSNLATEIVSKSYLKDLKPHLIPEGLQFKAFSTNAREKIVNTIELSPIFRENGLVKKVISFSVNYKVIKRKKSTNLNSELQNSILRSGKWYRFAIDTTGIYKLNKNFFNSLGINTSNLNPKKIKIYGHGGQSLPLVNNETISYDMIQNRVRFIGEDDGVFNDEDYLLFYGIGPKSFNSDNNSHINPYSDEVY